MKKIVIFLLFSLLTACTTKYQYKACNERVFLDEHKEFCGNHTELGFVELGGAPWPMWLLLPVAILAGASEMQQSVVNSPHYQAGGASYVDYTKTK